MAEEFKPEYKDIKGKQVSLLSLFRAAGMEGDPSSIIETPGMYPYKERVEDNWAFYTALGFKRLKELAEQEGKQIKEVGIVGIGSGVEGIAAARIFPGLKRLVISDIDDEVLGGSDENIKNATQNSDLEVVPLKGSFAEPMEKAGYKLDLIHGNIPNLPSTGSEDLSQGAEKGTFLPASLYEGYNPPDKFVGWAMGAQYAYLQSAKKALAKGGSVITELGGRIPLSLVKELFEENGLEMKEILVGFKEQTEALIDFQGYHRMEKDYGVSFDFYLYQEAYRALQNSGILNPSTNVTGQEVKDLLKSFRVNAGDAVDLYHKQVPVGHTVHLFRGNY